MCIQTPAPSPFVRYDDDAGGGDAVQTVSIKVMQADNTMKSISLAAQSGRLFGLPAAFGLNGFSITTSSLLLAMSSPAAVPFAAAVYHKSWSTCCTWQQRQGRQVNRMTPTDDWIGINSITSSRTAPATGIDSKMWHTGETEQHLVFARADDGMDQMKAIACVCGRQQPLAIYWDQAERCKWIGCSVECGGGKWVPNE